MFLYDLGIETFTSAFYTISDLYFILKSKIAVILHIYNKKQDFL